jgi:hypothetical protein
VACSTKPFDERASRRQIGKAEAKIDFVFFLNLPSLPHPNLSRRVKGYNPTAQSGIQSFSGKFNDVWVFDFVGKPHITSLAVTPV